MKKSNEYALKATPNPPSRCRLSIESRLAGVVRNTKRDGHYPRYAPEVDNTAIIRGDEENNELLVHHHRSKEAGTKECADIMQQHIRCCDDIHCGCNGMRCKSERRQIVHALGPLHKAISSANSKGHISYARIFSQDAQLPTGHFCK